MLVVFTGRGKGKTSAGMSTAIRALLSGKSVGYVQFMKVEGNSASKLSSFFPALDFYSFGDGAFVDPENPDENAIKCVEDGWTKCRELFGKKDLVVMDELNVALAFNLLDKDVVLKDLNEFTMPHINEPKPYRWPVLVSTGIDAPSELISIADLVTEMKEIKHPYKKGYLATKGIDF